MNRATPEARKSVLGMTIMVFVAVILPMAACAPQNPSSPAVAVVSLDQPLTPAPAERIGPHKKAIRVSYIHAVTQSRLSWDMSPASQNASPGPAERESKIQVTCAGDGGCPAGLAALSFEGRLQCTGLLISPDLIATDEHCLPQNLLKPGADCRSSIFVHFPKGPSGEKAETVGCAKVIGVSPGPIGAAPLSPDFAFLRLNRALKRATATLSREGFQNHQTLYVMTHFERRSDWWEYKPEPCETVYETLLGPKFNAPLNAIAHFAGCATSAGDSGSPVLDSNHEAAGILGGGFERSQLDLIENILGPRGILESPLVPHAWATNFACIPDPTDTRLLLPPDCDHQFTEMASSLELSPPQKQAVKLAVRDWNASGAPLKWKAVHAPQDLMEGFFYAVPECVSRDALAQLKSGWQTNLPAGSLKFNPSLELVPRTVAIRDIAVHVLALDADAGSVHVTVRQEDGSEKVLFDGTLPYCD